MKVHKRLIAGTAAAVMLALTCGGCGAEKKPVTITIWNYYNGEQLEAFNRMVQNFNDTVGKEQGITVESASQGSVNDLETNVLNAAEGKVGAEELPNIFSGYADTAYALDQQGMGLTEQQIGLYYGTFGVIAFVVGSILGGYFISWLKLRRALFPLVCIFNVPFVVYALLAWFQPSSPVLICAAIVFEYFSYGFGFVGLTLFIMQQVAPGPHQMAHYAFASGIMNLGVMLPGMMSGFFSDWLGYERFFIYVLLATIPSLLITYFIPFTYDDSKKESNR